MYRLKLKYRKKNFFLSLKLREDMTHSNLKEKIMTREPSTRGKWGELGLGRQAGPTQASNLPCKACETGKRGWV